MCAELDGSGRAHKHDKVNTPVVDRGGSQLQRFLEEVQVFAGLLVFCPIKSRLVERFARILEESPTSPRAHRVIAERVLTEAFNHLERTLSEESVSVQHKPLTLLELREHVARLMERPGSRSSGLVTRLLELLRQRHAEPHLTERQLAAELRRSVSYVSRLLNRETGRGFDWHLAAVRIAHAAELLPDGRLTIKQVAAHCGFASTSEFDRHFKRVLGVTPTTYRSYTTPPAEPASGFVERHTLS